jgi:hypothetical protein
VPASEGDAGGETSFFEDWEVTRAARISSRYVGTKNSAAKDAKLIVKTTTDVPETLRCAKRPRSRRARARAARRP